jgi:hypothetical protein
LISKLALNEDTKNLHHPEVIIMKNHDDKTDAVHGIGAGARAAHVSKTSWEDVQAFAQANNFDAQAFQKNTSENSNDFMLQAAQKIFGDPQIEQVSKEKFQSLFDKMIISLSAVQNMIQQQLLQELRGPALNPGLYASAGGLGNPAGSQMGDPHGAGSGVGKAPQAMELKIHAPSGPQSVDRPADRFRGSVGSRFGLFSRNRKKSKSKKLR